VRDGCLSVKKIWMNGIQGEDREHSVHSVQECSIKGYVCKGMKINYERELETSSFMGFSFILLEFHL
jgi:hypothetical protein